MAPSFVLFYGFFTTRHSRLFLSLLSTRSVCTHLMQFVRPDGPGVPLVVYSALLTRGQEVADGVVSDMDSGLGAAGTLIGAHNYATQELVNLLLTGRAHSNVFDGSRTLDDEAPQATAASGQESSLLLRGIPHRSDVGFLTLFEAFDYVRVGSYYKTPRVPIWVVCSESHYSVLFGAPRGAVFPPPATGGASGKSKLTFGMKTRGKVHPPHPARCLGLALLQHTEGDAGRKIFDIVYFNGQGGQDELLRLTITPASTDAGTHAAEDGAADDDDDDDAPPLERVIRTRWPRAHIDWNGSEPLL